MNDFNIANRDGYNDRNFRAVGRAVVGKADCYRLRAEAAIMREIVDHAERWLLLTVAVLGVGGVCVLAQCALAWSAIVAGAAIARRLIRLGYIGRR